MTDKEIFEAFLDRCIDARILWNTHQELFEERPTIEILTTIAPTFFSDLQGWLIRLLFIEVCALTDAKKQGSNSNLSIERIAEKAMRSSAERDKVVLLASSLNEHGERLRKARNTIIVHSDLATAMNNTKYGRTTESDWADFWDDLQSFCDFCAPYWNSKPLDFSVSAGPGDVTDFIRFLRKNSGKI